jgi:hypothetical protein
VEKFDHHDEHGRLFAAIVRFPGVGPLVELRLAPEAARSVAGYDPVTFGVADEQARMDPARADIHNPEISTATMSSFPDGRS